MTRSALAEIVAARRAAKSGQARRLREAARVSQAEIAQTVGVSQACVSRWESGARLPSGTLARRYTRVLRGLEEAVFGPASAPRQQMPRTARSKGRGE